MTYGQKGQITIDADPRIDSLMMQQTEINYQKDGVSGFRIQIKNTTTQKDANALRARFSRDFPELKSYLRYNAPYYKIRIGDYLTKLEAQKDLIKIKTKYKGAYPVPCSINLEEVLKKEK
tara:strand:- start:1 stop:360 length:360 start_codon:yes stop_codon:yes gene_type:complete